MRYRIIHYSALIRSIRETSYMLSTLLIDRLLNWLLISRRWCNRLLRSVRIVKLVLLCRSTCRCRMMTIIQLLLFQLLLFLNIG